MAGIGFELRRLLDRQSLWGLVRAYAYAGVISSGPWVLSILGVMGIGLLSVGPVPAVEVRQFLVTITYLMAGSLILTGGLQLMFARFIADCLYRRRRGARAAEPLRRAHGHGRRRRAARRSPAVRAGRTAAVRLLTVVALIVLSTSWIAVVLLSSLRDYRGVVLGFLVGYSISVGGALLLRPLGLVGLLAGFLVGQVVLLLAMVGLIARRFPSKALVSFEFLDRRRAYFTLAATGFLYNLGIWIDKLLFWFTPSTSEPVLGPAARLDHLRHPDLPRVPVDRPRDGRVPRAGRDRVRRAVRRLLRRGPRGRARCADIRRRRDRLTLAVKRGVSDIFKVQGITVLILLLAAPRLLDAVGISPLYLQLFSVDLAGVAMQVLMLAVFNVLFYLDQRRTTLALSATFAVLNAALTVATQHAGPPFYGYGFALSTALTSLIGLLLTSRALDRLEADTFMRVE